MSIALFKGTEKGFRKSQRWWYNGWEVGRKDRRQTQNTHTNQPTRSPRRVGISWVALRTQEGKETLSEGQTTQQ